MSNFILSCKNLCKSYKAPVLKNLNIDLPSGKIIGLLGPNGCGKSTFMKLVCGLLVPDSGEIFICGEPRSEKTNALVSYLPERTYFNNSMQVDELIRYFSDFYNDFNASKAKGMMYDLEIDTTAKLKTLSKGTKEKVQLVLGYGIRKHGNIQYVKAPKYIHIFDCGSAYVIAHCRESSGTGQFLSQPFNIGDLNITAVHRCARSR